jgi:hypothetical protein
VEKSMSTEMARLFAHAPDVYYAASIITDKGLYIGKGDTGRIVEELISSKTKIKDAKEKLQLI